MSYHCVSWTTLIQAFQIARFESTPEFVAGDLACGNELQDAFGNAGEEGALNRREGRHFGHHLSRQHRLPERSP